MTEIFDKEPYLVVKAIESGTSFSDIIDCLRDANPEMALAAIDFWNKFAI